MRQRSSVANRIQFARHVFRNGRCELLGIRWAARAVAKPEHRRGIVVYVTAESANAHIERCKEEVEVPKESIDIARAQIGRLHELPAYGLRGDAGKPLPLCQLGDRRTEIQKGIGFRIGNPRPRTIPTQSGGGYSRQLAHLFRHAVELFDIRIQLFVKLHFALSRCLLVLVTMVLRKCALKRAITILAIVEPGNSVVSRFLVSENERDSSSSERQETPCLENTRQQHQPLRKLAP